MLISNVGCEGHESSVIDCPFNFVHDCLITDVAGVQCISKYISLCIIINQLLPF